MPEGDSVFRQAAKLHDALAGHRLISSDFRVPAYATVDLSAERIEKVVARGKHLLIHVGGVTIQSHLKMEGVWHVYDRHAGGSCPRWKRPGYTARCVLTTQEHQAVGFSLGELRVIKRGEEVQLLSHLGPDLLGPDWDADKAESKLRTRPERSIGMALLDQSNLAGIGNVYRSEVCFLAGIRPHLPVAEVPDLRRVIDLSRRLLEVNKLRSRRCTTGSPTSPVQYWVYGRKGKLCMRCHSSIIRAELGEEELRKAAVEDRVIYFCPRCQPDVQLPLIAS